MATLSDVLEAGDVGVVCHAWLVITGADGHRLHEELVIAGGPLRHGRWRRIDTLRDLDTLLRSAGDEPTDRDRTDDAVRWWDDVVEQGLNRALERRAETVQASKRRELAERAQAEADAVRAVLTDLQRQITADLDELDADRMEQRSLFTDPGREQSQRDLDALRRRLEEIPDEIEREVEVTSERLSLAHAWLTPRRNSCPAHLGMREH